MTITANKAANSAKDAVNTIINMLNYHDDFIIVQSAGNGNDNAVGIDAQKYNGYFASITPEIITSALEELKENNYKFNREITVEDVQCSYMAVGAVDKKKNKDNWQLATFSNYGDAITVCAPGVDIFSTVVTGGWDGDYGKMSGTSMAAPIVSGIVAMVWSIDPTMSAKQVQNIIQSTADQTVLSRNENDTGTYSMINAKTAVEKAIEVLEEKENSNETKPVRTTSGERDVVLTLDTSGSMRGDPISETKTASSSFIKAILNEDASIGIVTYANEASVLSDFSVDEDLLIDSALSLWGDGGTNIEAGLAEAHSMLDLSNAKKKIIVLMSDGEPNVGKEGDDLIAYADEIKDDGITIYTLGFFEGLSSSKAAAQALMEEIASDGCHYEVANAEDLAFFFGDVADQINGQKYIYIRIACPVDVSVTYNGETLSSAEDNLNTRTDFGTLTFEDNENANSSSSDDKVKVLRLKEGADYDIEIVGTGHGLMDLTFGFMDEDGEYSDFRYFEDVKITKNTVIHATATVADETVVNIDNDGDGKHDLKLRAEENGFGEEVETPVLLYVIIVGVAVLLLAIIIKVRKHRKYSNTKENY